jgi:hypothetical protein
MQKVADRSDNPVKLVASHIKIALLPSEYLSKEQFIEIAEEALDDLGYTDNPYLLWLHNDTLSLHAHLVTTTVKKNGEHVPSNYEGLDSNKLEEMIEEKYNLILITNFWPSSFKGPWIYPVLAGCATLPILAMSLLWRRIRRVETLTS